MDSGVIPSSELGAEENVPLRDLRPGESVETSIGIRENDGEQDSNDEVDSGFSRFKSLYDCARSLMLPKSKLSGEDGTGRPKEFKNYWPVFIIFMTFLEIGFFVYDAIYLKNEKEVWQTPINRVLFYDPKKRYELWRYFTYMFVHIGWHHIIFNVALQLTLGVLLEMVHGWWRVLVIYLAGVLGGSLACSVFLPTMGNAGASAGGYALFSAHLATLLFSWTELNYRWGRIAVFLFYLLGQVALARYMLHADMISLYAQLVSHIGGVVAGFVVGNIVLRNLEQYKWEKLFYRMCALALFFFVVFAISLNICYSIFSEIL